MRILEKTSQKEVDFKSLKTGDCFLDSEGDLMIKTDTDQGGIQLNNGVMYTNLCGDMVTPVNVEAQIID